VIAYAAIDLRGGRVVQLVGGRPETERVSLPDPAAVARRWIDAGFAALHVVDLDALDALQVLAQVVRLAQVVVKALQQTRASSFAASAVQ
jgi:phosphoribosylformimino-5-aminoimidazole carboxamide ribotide isomerase